jgi:hypothetical protein
MKYLNLSILILFFSSCDIHFTEKEMYGFYSPENYKNTYDTIYLKPQGIYHRKVFDKNRKLALEMYGKWVLEKNTTIRFESFFLNLDRDIIKFPELLSDTSDNGGGWIDTKKNNIQFCVGYNEGENCYQKVNQ